MCISCIETVNARAASNFLGAGDTRTAIDGMVTYADGVTAMDSRIGCLRSPVTTFLRVRDAIFDRRAAPVRRHS